MYWAHNTAVFHNQTSSEPELVKEAQESIPSRLAGRVRQPYLAHTEQAMTDGIDSRAPYTFTNSGSEDALLFYLILTFLLPNFTSFYAYICIFQCDPLIRVQQFASMKGTILNFLFLFHVGNKFR